MPQSGKARGVISAVGAAFLLFLGMFLHADMARADDPAKGPYIGMRGFLVFTDVDDVTFSSPDSSEFTILDDAIEFQGGLSLAFGYEWSKHLKLPIRTELEGNWRVSHDLDGRAQSSPDGAVGYNNHVANLNPMVNVLLDIPTGSFWRPYVGGGVGVSFNVSHVSNAPIEEPEGSTDQHINASFAWSLQAGLHFRWSRNWAIQAGYRFSNLGRIDTGTLAQNVAAGDRFVGEDFTAHDILLGINYMF